MIENNEHDEHTEQTPATSEATDATSPATWDHDARGQLLHDRRWSSDGDGSHYASAGTQRAIILDASWLDGEMRRMQVVNLAEETLDRGAASPAQQVRHDIVIQTWTQHGITYTRLSWAAAEALIAAIELWRREHDQQQGKQRRHDRTPAEQLARIAEHEPAIRAIFTDDLPF